MDLFQIAASLGGFGGFIAVLILFFYRNDRKETIQAIKDERQETEQKLTKLIDDYRLDRKETVDQVREDRKLVEDRLTRLIEQDQETRSKNATALQELTTLIQRLNGKMSK